MAAPESTKFQVNFKSPDGTLINLYAANKEELESLLAAAQDFSALIGSVSQSFSGATSAAPVRAAAPVVNKLDDRVNPPAAGPAAALGSTICRHGVMAYKEGVSAKGPWKGYMCQAPKGATDKCQTIWVR
jgi:hypothetical protein